MLPMEIERKDISEKLYGFVFHYYRAEVYRETNWRNRLDATTNWAIVVTAGMASFAFSNAAATHVVLILNAVVVFFFLYIESRRFRNYSYLKSRTRLVEQQLLAPIMRGEAREVGSVEELAKSLELPRTKMSRIESLGWRLRRNYVFLFGLIYVMWVVKVLRSPLEKGFFEDARVMWVPGLWIVFGFSFFVVLMGALAYFAPKARGSVGHDLP